MRTRLRSKVTLLFMTCALLLAIPAVAFAADNLNDTNDDLTGNLTTKALGNITQGTTGSGSAVLVLDCNGNTHAARGSSLLFDTVQKTVNSGPSGSASELSVTPSLTVPNDWPLDKDNATSASGACDNNTQRATGSAAISVTVPENAALGARTIQVKITPSSGQDVNGTAQFDVTYNVVAATLTDADSDGVADATDNCPNTANANQTDTDGDGQGDACDTQDNRDSDSDNVQNYQDNCVNTPNTDQADLDNDGVGDACDPDRDGDGVNNDTDNCADTANPGQADADNDGVGTACDPDETPPVIDYTLDPASPDGSNGWYKSDVTLTWSVTDPESDVVIDDGCVDQNITADQAETPYSCSASSGGGSAGPVEVNIKRDGTAPVITDAGAKSAPDGANGWYITEAFNKFTASDSPSGLADTTKDSFEVGTGTDEGADLTVESGPVSDKAGNTAASETSAASFNVDLSNPHSVAFVGGPAAGSSHYFGSLPSAAPTCTAEDEVSGLEDCEVTDYSTAVGTHTMTAKATDKAGRTATTTRTYTVDPWTMKGFYQPVDMTPANATSPVYNTVKGGSTVPFKFEVFAGSTELTDPTSTIGGNSDVKVAPINCDGTGIEDAIETTATGGTVLRYDSTAGQFVFNWQTPKKPGTCYKVTIPTKDGVSSLSAHFKLK